jgi:hypothetical protein
MQHPWRSPLVMLKVWDSTSQTYSKIQIRWMVMFWPPAVSVPRRKLLSFLEHFIVTRMFYRVMGGPALCCCTVLQMNYSKRTPARFHHHPSLWGRFLSCERRHAETRSNLSLVSEPCLTTNSEILKQRDTSLSNQPSSLEFVLAFTFKLKAALQ